MAAVPNPRQARATLQDMVRRLGYPYQTESLLVAQMLDVWMHYRLAPVVLPNPQQAVVAPTAAAPPQQQIICLSGNLPILVSNRHYPIPLRVYVLMPFPHVNPLVYVVPYAGAVVPRGHPFVDATSGSVDVTAPTLPQGIWRPAENSIAQILRRLQEGFSLRPPLIEDPEFAEKREKAARLSYAVRAKLHEKTEEGRREFLEAAQELVSLRQEDERLGLERRKWAAHVGSGVGVELASTREQLLRVEELLREYGVGAGEGTGTAVVLMSSDVKGAPPVVVGGGGGPGADIGLEDLLLISSGHPLRDQIEELEAEEKAVEDALEQIGETMRLKLISLDGFQRKSKELAGMLCQIRARMAKVGAEMAAAVEAEEGRAGGGGLQGAGAPGDRAAGGFEHGGYGGGGHGGYGGGGHGTGSTMRSRSTLLTSGMLPVRLVRAGPGGASGRVGSGPLPPPPPGPPTLRQQGSGIGFAQ